MKILWLMKKQLDVALDRTVRLEMMSALDRLGHEVVFVTGYRHARDDFGFGDRIVYLPSSPLPFVHHARFSRAVARRLPALVARHRPDVVMLDPWTAAPAAGWARGCARQADRPLIVTDVRTLPVGASGIKAALAEMTFARGIRAADSISDGVTAITKAMREELVARYGLRAETPSAIWTSGVNTERFDPARIVGVRRLREDLGIGDAPLFVYHGSLTLERGVGDLVSAVAAPSFPDGGHLVLVGGGADMEALKRIVAERSLADRVHVLPPAPNAEMPAIIAEADAGVLPLPDLAGWRVSSPIKLFEYLAMGKPVVVTDIVAHRYAVDGLASAIFCEPGPDALAVAMSRVASMPASERESLGAVGREAVLARHTWDAQASALVDFLMGLRTGGEAVKAG